MTERKRYGMTVKELIKELLKFPQDYKVLMDGSVYWYNIGSISDVNDDEGIKQSSLIFNEKYILLQYDSVVCSRKVKK